MAKKANPNRYALDPDHESDPGTMETHETATETAVIERPEPKCRRKEIDAEVEAARQPRQSNEHEEAYRRRAKGTASADDFMLASTAGHSEQHQKFETRRLGQVEQYEKDAVSPAKLEALRAKEQEVHAANNATLEELAEEEARVLADINARRTKLNLEKTTATDDVTRAANANQKLRELIPDFVKKHYQSIVRANTEQFGKKHSELHVKLHFLRIAADRQLKCELAGNQKSGMDGELYDFWNLICRESHWTGVGPFDQVEFMQNLSRIRSDLRALIPDLQAEYDAIEEQVQAGRARADSVLNYYLPIE